jgi:hypothetical protein
MSLPFFWAHGAFLAEATPRPIIGFLVNEANCLKIIDYDQAIVCLALLLLNGFWIENPSSGSLSMASRGGPLEVIQKVLAMG